MERQVASVPFHLVEHGAGTAVLVLHGAGVDHREAEACFEPALGAAGGLRRIYPDLPGMGRTPAPEAVASAEDVLALLLGLVDEVVGDGPLLVAGHSAGGCFAHAVAARRPAQVVGMAAVCPLLPETRDVPAHRPVVAASGLGDEGFRDYFVVQTPAMLDRYERFVAPAIPLVDAAAMDRIGARWDLDLPDGGRYPGAALIVAGAQDATVGSAAAIDLRERCPGDARRARRGGARPPARAARAAGRAADRLGRPGTARCGTQVG